VYGNAGTYAARLEVASEGHVLYTRPLAVNIGTEGSRTALLTPGAAGSRTLALRVTGSARCTSGRYQLQRRDGDRWTVVREGTFGAASTVLHVPAPARYRVIVPANTTAGGYCPEATTGTVQVRPAAVVTTTTPIYTPTYTPTYTPPATTTTTLQSAKSPPPGP
jgi:hypothetical protein